MSRLFDAAPIALALFDGRLRMRRANQVMKAMNGLSDVELAGTPAPVLLPGVDPRAWDVIREVFATGKPVWDAEVHGVTPRSAPDERIWNASYYPIRDRHGTIAAVGAVAVDVTDQRRALREQQAVNRRLELLRRASTLVGRSLELTETLEGMVELIVPEFADLCVLSLADEPFDGDARPDPLLLRRVAWAQSPPMAPLPGPAHPGRLVAYPEDGPDYRALVRGGPVHTTMDEAALRTMNETPYGGDYIRRNQLREGISAPLLVGGEFHGVVHCCHGVSGRSYSAHDLETAGELAGRIASALANARAYARQRATAITLQRGLLPRETPAVEGLEIVSRYEPGTVGTQVGGDWFDVIPLSAGRVALVIGDVMGRGLTAAAVMGQVRSAVRAFAALDLPAGDVLTHLDALVQTLGTGPDGALVSALYLIWEPVTGTVALANAGHFAPALRHPDGTVEFLESPARGVILGVTKQTFTEVRHRLPVGATLALFTDGVVESAAIDIDEGTRRLRDALASDGGDLAATADRLLTLIDRTHGFDDDAAVLLVGVPASDTAAGGAHGTVAASFPPDPAVAKSARDLARATLERWGLPEAVFVTELLVSELVTNAIRYTAMPCDLTLRYGERALYVEVSDADTRVPTLLHPTDTDEDGRGLQLVAILSTAWGSRTTRTGKTVWFQLDHEAAGGPARITPM
jgi:PAS domain S-box-containing protein